jgi:hypothetical protein
MEILNKASKEKPRNLWKKVDQDRYQVNAIYFIIHYKIIQLIF